MANKIGYLGKSGYLLGSTSGFALASFWGGITPALSLNFTSGTLDSRITFSRPSLATMYDSTGKLTYAPNNLLTYSQDFTNANWAIQSSGTKTTGQTDPNGGTTACLVAGDGVTNYSGIAANSVLRPNGVGIGSVYVKAGTATKVAILGLTGSFSISFDLSNGTYLGNVGATGVSYAISSVGNGWYRISYATTFPGTPSKELWIAPITALGTYTSSGNIYVAFGQFEAVTYQTTPSTYVATTASAYYGPRFDYNPSTLAARGLLIEEARTNNHLYSQDFTNATWTKAAASVTAGSITGPDGASTGTKVQATAGNNIFNLYGSGALTTTNTVVYTQSFYAKYGNAQWLWVRVGNPDASWAAFDLLNGVTGNKLDAASAISAYTITSVGNGWYRCTMTWTANASAAYNIVWTMGTGSTPTAAGVAQTGSEYFYLYGAQYETGSFATSYIPTGSSSVARSGEFVTMTGTNFSSWFNSSEGTFVSTFTLSALNTAMSQELLTADDGSNNNLITVLANNTSGDASSTANAAGVNQGYLSKTGAALARVPVKLAYGYKVNDTAFTNDGNSVSTDTTYSVPTGVNRIAIGSRTSGFGIINGWISAFSYYRTRLTDAQIQTLSAWTTPTAALSLDFTTGSLDNRITFSRPSLATMYDSTGKLTFAPNNLVTYSNDFSNAAWTKTNVTASSAADSTFGTIWTLTDSVDASSLGHALLRLGIYSIGDYQASVYAKAGTKRRVCFGFNSSGGVVANAYAVFDLVSGTLVATGNSMAATSIVAVGGGWYRLSVTRTNASSEQRWVLQMLSDSATAPAAYQGDGTGTIQIAWAQAEAVTYQTSPSTYVATTSAAYYGPRFDYNPSTLAARGLLIEEARTNIKTYSQGAFNTQWTKAGTTVSDSASTGPDGATSFSRITEDTTNSTHLVTGDINITSGTQYTVSVYAKAGSGSQRWLQAYMSFAAGGSSGVVFNLNSGTATATAGTGSATGSIDDIGNGIYRCKYTFTAQATGIYQLFFALANASGLALNGGYTGDGSSNILLMGAQVEAGSFATSYIPTGSASVARSADVAYVPSATVPSFRTNGAVYADVMFIKPAYGQGIVSDSNSSTEMGIFGSTTFCSYDGTSETSMSSTALSPLTRYKAINSFMYPIRVGVVNGGSTLSSAFDGAFTGTNLYLGTQTGSGAFINGWISAVSIYDQYLRPKNIQTLTS